MSPQTARNAHISYRQNIPANLVQKWQSSPRQAARSRVRRPKTACEWCRTSKVRCRGDGKDDCDRCTSRCLPCRYVALNPAPSPVDTATTSCSDPGRITTPEEIRADSDSNTYHARGQADDDAASLQRMLVLGSATTWPDMNSAMDALIQQQQHTDWGSIEPLATLNSPGAFLTPSIEEQQQPSLESLGLFPLITSATADSLSWQDQLASESCQCRAGLAQLIPNARAALRDRRLDEAFRVTDDVIGQCKGIVGCRACATNCTDLICIMAIFQEVDVCFEYAGNGEIDKSIGVMMGSYEVEFGMGEQDAQECRRMLVTQLVRRAHRLLDSISERGQDMLRHLDPECRLGRVNINYLEAVIANSRENLHHVLEGLEKATPAE